MNPRELRIGNFVFVRLDTPPMPIATVNLTDFILLDKGKDHLLPIPLAPEWLEKFGFYCPFVGVYEIITRRMDMIFRIYKVSGDLFIIGNYESSASPIQYVHQLQNLYFALTGEELTIVNQQETTPPHQQP